MREYKFKFSVAGVITVDTAWGHSYSDAWRVIELRYRGSRVRFISRI